MSDEIKETLDKLGKKSSIYKFQINQGTSFNTDEYEASILLDYITNLQEENERLKKGLEYAKRIEKDYKTKFDKAIEYIELWHYRNDFRANSFTKDVKEELLDILKGNKWNEVERAYLDDKPIGSDKEW